MSWWQQTLQGQQPAAPPAVSVRPMYQTPVPPQGHVQQPVNNYPPTQAPARMPDSVSAEHCPECGSGNFYAPKTDGKMTNNGMVYASGSCFDCGYPKVQFGSAGGEGSAQSASRDVPSGGRARQVGSQKTGYNPGTIVGRLG